MKKIILCIISSLFLLSCMAPVTALADSQSTTVSYSVPATVIYMDYDRTSTTQKVEVGTKLIEPAPKGKPGYTFSGWKNEKTGQLWDFTQPVTEHLTLTAVYRESTNSKKEKIGEIPIEHENDRAKTNTTSAAVLIHSPRTGDTTDLLGYGIMLIASVTGLLGWLILRKKKTK